MFGIAPEWYYKIYLGIVTVVTMWVLARLWMSRSERGISERENEWGLWTLALILAILIGTRDYTSGVFGDSRHYGYLLEYGLKYGYAVHKEEVAWVGAVWLWWRMGLPAMSFFVVMALVYMLCYAVAYKRIFRQDALVGFLFFLLTFSTWPYAVNGVRNGVATAIGMLGLAFVIEPRRALRLAGFALLFLATLIHRSMMLPLVCAAASLFIRDFRISVGIWTLCLAITLIFGNLLVDIISTLGLDKRLTVYVDYSSKYMQIGSPMVGFRWDFLLYSLVPIVWAWYVLVFRKKRDRVFLMFANVYVLANAFWLLYIRAFYTNRFAYLSWFLYPIIIAYPLLRMKLTDHPRRLTAPALLLYLLLNKLI